MLSVYAKNIDDFQNYDNHSFIIQYYYNIKNRYLITMFIFKNITLI